MRKIACIFHAIDLDGWMSAAIVKHWHEMKKLESSITFIGYNYGQEIPDTSEFDQVIMVDISFPVDVMLEIYQRNHERTSLVWIDHHISAMNDWEKLRIETGVLVPIGITDTKFAACELTWKYFFPNDAMPEIVRLLGRYDCFGHKGTSEEKKVLEFQYGARSCISNPQEAFDELIQCMTYFPESGYPTREGEILLIGQGIYGYLCTEARSEYKKGYPFESLKDVSNTRDSDDRYRFLAINKARFNPVNFGIDYHKDGYDGVVCYHFDGKKWNFSLYNDNGLVDCSEIAKRFGGGGHKGASGFVTNYIEPFLPSQI